MSWQHPLILFTVPVALLAAWWLFRGRQTKTDERLPNIARRWADRLGLHSAAPVITRRGRGFALALAAALALVALARPQWGEIPEHEVSRSREVMIALDLSQSMMADDVSPTRLARAKLLVDALLDALHGERVGLTVFAGTAFVQSPLSADYEVLREFLASLDTSYLPQGGTDYASMLQAAGAAFGSQGNGDRYLVVLSDGEATDDEWQKAVPALRERGIRVIGLGVGTPQGALVPAADGGVLKDESGNAVLSKLEPATLQQLAEQTGGTYRDAATWVDIADLVNATVAKGHAGDYVEERRVHLEDRFQWFLAPALLLFLLSYWLEFPLTPLARALSTRGRRPLRASAPAIAAALIGLVAWQPPRQALAVATDQPPPPRSVATDSQPPDLSKTIAELSAKPALDAPDYERLAGDTIGFASQPTSPRGPARDGIIDDALAAVDRGEQRDAKAADWPKLRQQLEALRKPPEQPKNDQQQKQDQQQQDQQNQQQQGQQDQQQQGQQDQQQNQQNSGGGQQQQDQNQQQNAGDGQPHDGKQDQQAKQNADQKPNADQKQGAEQQKQDGPQSPQNADAQQQPSGDGKHEQQAKQDQQNNDGKPQSDDAEQQGGEVKRQQETKPVESAGLGDEKEPKPEERKAEKEAQQQQSEAQQAPEPPKGTRMVGGGQVVASASQSSDPATADALARMEHVKDGDAPAVLFDRMNRAEGQPQPKKNGKNW